MSCSSGMEEIRARYEDFFSLNKFENMILFTKLHITANQDYPKIKG